MAYPAAAVANYFIDRAMREGSPLTPMKLQKLVYFAHGWFLAVAGQPLIDEQVEAWQFGPVVPSLYHEFKSFGNGPITRPAVAFENSAGTVRLVRPTITATTGTVVDVLDRVWQLYSKYSATALSQMTHAPGTPWDTMWRAMGSRIIAGTDIPQDTIRAYFTSLARSTTA